MGDGLCPRVKVLGATVDAEAGAPDRIRTCGLCLRRATLYPAELRVLEAGLSDADG